MILMILKIVLLSLDICILNVGDFKIIFSLFSVLKPLFGSSFKFSKIQ